VAIKLGFTARKRIVEGRTDPADVPIASRFLRMSRAAGAPHLQPDSLAHKGYRCDPVD
jgi:hypothetical protein